jgi:FxsC-like protein
VKRAGTKPGPFFFMSYAQTPERPWVEKLFRDIQSEIFERTTLPGSSHVGFMDTSGVSLGGHWRDEIGRALATCQVFVPLYSPRYFISRECGAEWHVFAQRVLDHQAHYPGKDSYIVPALWTPVRPESLPQAAQQIQIHHADLGAAYAKEGFYTLIKNGSYREEYLTAVQRLALHVISAAEGGNLRTCDTRDLDWGHNAFDLSGHPTPADRILNIVVIAPTRDCLPDGRSADFYGYSALEWNPFHPTTQQVIVEYAAGLARLSGYETAILNLDDGMDFLTLHDTPGGLGLLVVDVWAAMDPYLAERLAELDSASGWIAMMAPLSVDDRETMLRSVELRKRLSELMPHRLGPARPFNTVNANGIGTLKDFRNRMVGVLGGALHGYLNHAEAYPPTSDRIPDRPRLVRQASEKSGNGREAGERHED